MLRDPAPLSWRSRTSRTRLLVPARRPLLRHVGHRRPRPARLVRGDDAVRRRPVPARGHAPRRRARRPARAPQAVPHRVHARRGRLVRTHRGHPCRWERSATARCRRSRRRVRAARLAQYDPLLADVAPRGRRGRLSGIAVAFGFIGIFFALAVVAEGIVGDGSNSGPSRPRARSSSCSRSPRSSGSKSGITSPRRRHDPREAPTARVCAGRPDGTAGTRQSGRVPVPHRPVLLLGRDRDALGLPHRVHDAPGGFSETENNAVLAVSVVGAAAAALVTGRVLGRTGPRAVLLAVLPVFTALTLLSAAVGQPWTVCSQRPRWARLWAVSGRRTASS